MTPAQRARERLTDWPDLTAGPAGCGTGQALRSPHGEIVHFHSGHDVDLHLTDSALRRWSADLGASSAIRLVPGSGWVTVHLDCDTDVDLLLSLVSMALKAQQADGACSGACGCNLHRVTVLPRLEAG
ncbi:luciferase domain-containing protein [Streptomyces sp. enrichment culture]|uniref:luciferase domain-containing protein n=1 Tax=Streptomyces sp. enrichment culture TaxID=1795815 RepID=UPI003F542C92